MTVTHLLVEIGYGLLKTIKELFSLFREKVKEVLINCPKSLGWDYKFWNLILVSILDNL